MTETQAAWVLAIAGGGAVGVVYFGTLWWTVQRAARTSRPVLFVAGSFLVRGVVAAAVLVGVAGGDPWRLLAAAGAFLVVRIVVVQIARTTTTPATRPSAQRD